MENMELKINQIDIKDAENITVEDMVKEQQRDKHTISKADIMLIFTVYGALDLFLKKYLTYVDSCRKNGFTYCQPPHYFLKYQIG